MSPTSSSTPSGESRVCVRYRSAGSFASVRARTSARDTAPSEPPTPFGGSTQTMSAACATSPRCLSTAASAAARSVSCVSGGRRTSSETTPAAAAIATMSRARRSDARAIEKRPAFGSSEATAPEGDGLEMDARETMVQRGRPGLRAHARRPEKPPPASIAAPECQLRCVGPGAPQGITGHPGCSHGKTGSRLARRRRRGVLFRARIHWGEGDLHTCARGEGSMNMNKPGARMAAKISKLTSKTSKVAPRGFGPIMTKVARKIGKGTPAEGRQGDLEGRQRGREAEVQDHRRRSKEGRPRPHRPPARWRSPARARSRSAPTSRSSA